MYTIRQSISLHLVLDARFRVYMRDHYFKRSKKVGVAYVPFQKAMGQFSKYDVHYWNIVLVLEIVI